MSQTVDRTASTPAKTTETPAVDVTALGELLMGRWADVRREARALSARPEVRRELGLSMHDHRKRVMEHHDQQQAPADHGATPFRWHW